MPQKILAGRAADPLLQGDLVQVKVDQVVLVRAPARALAEAQALGVKKTPVEVAVAYDGTCVSDASTCEARAHGQHDTVPPEALLHGVLLARPGVGFPAPLHLERFASPGRLAVTDDPRLCHVGGIGMLSLVLPPSQLGHALAHGNVTLRPARSVQVLLSGRVRPFVCARDVALELLRRGIGDVIRRIDAEHRAPVIIEFAGPSARLLSVPDRAVLCSIAPAVGAASALFVSDDKSETFLRDQRRSKAHRTLAPDAGAPCDDVLSLDLAAVDPLLMDVDGEIKPVRDLAGTPVHQVVLGGDSGVTLRDMLAAASLLKSKRVPPRLELLVAPPSRQILEVLANTGALVDLVATGARLIEPDHRLITGELYPTPPRLTSIRTMDPEPRSGRPNPFIVASAETLAFSVANGQVGDPRSFKRPVRVTVPRILPTEDVLILRPRRSSLAGLNKTLRVEPATPFRWPGALELRVVASLSSACAYQDAQPAAIVLHHPDDVRRVEASALSMAKHARAVIAPHVPSATVAVLHGLGVAVFSADAEALACVEKAATVRLPAPDTWPDNGSVSASTADGAVALRWLGNPSERAWLTKGVAHPASASFKLVARCHRSPRSA
jgi:aconitate hydratase